MPSMGNIVSQDGCNSSLSIASSHQEMFGLPIAIGRTETNHRLRRIAR